MAETGDELSIRFFIILGLGLTAGSGAMDVLSSSGFALSDSDTTTGTNAAVSVFAFLERRYSRNAVTAMIAVAITEPTTAPAITAVFDIAFPAIVPFDVPFCPLPGPLVGEPLGLPLGSLPVWCGPFVGVLSVGDGCATKTS
jgi:hypothetical protein